MAAGATATGERVDCRRGMERGAARRRHFRGDATAAGGRVDGRRGRRRVRRGRFNGRRWQPSPASDSGVELGGMERGGATVMGGRVGGRRGEEEIVA